jgi:hypothetical protein
MPVGSRVPRYVLQFLFSEKSKKLNKPESSRKNKHKFGILGILEMF